MKKFLAITTVVFLVALFVGTLFFLYERSQAKEMVYDTHHPFVTDIVKKAVATGSVVPRKEVDVKPRISGIIDKLYVEPGQKVKKGDLIAQVTIVPNMLNLSSAESRVAQAKISLDKATQDFARNQKLYHDGLISNADFQDFQVAREKAEEELEAARDNLAVIREGARRQSAASANTMIRATISGMVLTVPVEVGNSVIEANNFNDGTTIASIADMDDMVFKGNVDESEVGQLKKGMDLELTVGALEDQRFDAKLEYIAPKGVEVNGAIQFEIRAALASRPGVMLRANYSANADIVLARRDKVLAVKESWLEFDGDNPYVEVETGPQTFVRRDVKTGLSDGINIAVLSGVTAKDEIKDPNSGHPAGAPEPSAAAGG